MRHHPPAVPAAATPAATPAAALAAALLAAVTGAAASAAACADPDPARTAAPASAGAASVLCTREGGDGVRNVVANAHGVAIALAVNDDTVVIRRAHGTGCDLSFFGAPIVAEALLDYDDNDNVYAFPADVADIAHAIGEPTRDDEGTADDGSATVGATAREAARGALSGTALVSTMLPDEYRGSMVAIVDVGGGVHKLMDAGRGIWGFGVTAAGDALWQSACGPDGVFAVTHDDEGVPVASPLSSLALPAGWAPGVLVDAATLFSLGWREDGRLDLLRTTPDGTRAVAQVAGTSALARCGGGVCVVGDGAVELRDAAGALVTTVGAPAPVVDVSANAGALYLHLDDGRIVLSRLPNSGR